MASASGGAWTISTASIPSSASAARAAMPWSSGVDRQSRAIGGSTGVEAGGAQRLPGQHRRAAGVGQDGDARPVHDRRRGQHPGGVEQGGDRRDLDQPRLLVQRPAGGPDRRRPGAHGHDRSPPRHAPGDPGELAGVAERLGVHGDDLGRFVVLPELQQVVAGHVGLVAERHEPRDADAEVAGELQDRRSERAGLQRDGDGSGRQLDGDQRGLQRRSSARTWRSPCSRVRRCAGRSGGPGRPGSAGRSSSPRSTSGSRPHGRGRRCSPRSPPPAHRPGRRRRPATPHPGSTPDPASTAGRRPPSGCGLTA